MAVRVAPVSPGEGFQPLAQQAATALSPQDLHKFVHVASAVRRASGERERVECNVELCEVNALRTFPSMPFITTTT